MIELRNLTKNFIVDGKNFTALDNINLTINDGMIYGIIGMSGAGKSTLVRCINMLERPSSGTVLIDGNDLSAMPAAQLRGTRRSISMIFQQFNLLMQRTCLKNICFPMEIVGVPAAEARKRAMELLDIVGLPDKANSYPAQLSGGQKQRIAIARALASNPKVLMCDEATSALDPTTTRAILKLIQDINKRLGITVIIITHEMSVIEEICSHVAILSHGKVVEEGRVEDIFSNPQTVAARKLVYPDGVQLDPQINGHIIRVAFNGGTVYEPLISSLVMDCNVKVNILGADMRNIDGKAFGTMMLDIPNNPCDISKVKSYLTSQPNISIEEVNDYNE